VRSLVSDKFVRDARDIPQTLGVRTTNEVGSSLIGKLCFLKNLQRGAWSIISALVLACLTLGVFYVFQDFGPESAIRRFNEACIRNNDDELQSVIAENFQRNNVLLLKQQLRTWYENGATMQLAEMERSEKEVRAAVLFTIPPNQDYPLGTQWAMIWVVTRRGKFWLVDANKTATILTDALPRLRVNQGF